MIITVSREHPGSKRLGFHIMKSSIKIFNFEETAYCLRRHTSSNRMFTKSTLCFRGLIFGLLAYWTSLCREYHTMRPPGIHMFQSTAHDLHE